MPASRSTKLRCAFSADPLPKVRKPAQPRKSLTAEEKEAAKADKEKRKSKLEAKKAWEASLEVWKPNSDLRFPIGTMAMYKSDAKSAYSLTEGEMLTLRHEAIPNSSKTFYSQDDVEKLAQRKFDAGASKDGVGRDDVKGELRLFKKTDDNNRSRRANFSPQFFGYVDPKEYRYRRGY